MLMTQQFIASSQAATVSGLALNASVTAPMGAWAALSLTGPIGASASGVGAVWISNPGSSPVACKWWLSTQGSAPLGAPADFTVPANGSHVAIVPFTSGAPNPVDTLLLQGIGTLAQAGAVFGHVVTGIDIGTIDVLPAPVGS